MSDDDQIDVHSLQPDGMTTEQWRALVDAGLLPAGAENACLEFSEGPEPQSWTVQTRWIEFPDV